jgi:AcrR family transcriptional regulator
MPDRTAAVRRNPLDRRQVLTAAVALADKEGVESLSMRRLAGELGVVPMALYKHVANKEELLDGMVDTIVGDIDPLPSGLPWKEAVRARVLSARQTFQVHPWARRVVETRTNKTAAVLDYMDTFTGIFLAGGLSADLTHHALHALGGRMWGFTQELFEDPEGGPDPTATAAPAAQAAMLQQLARRYPSIAAVAAPAAHDGGTVVAYGCDDQFEFEFALDLLLDGIERLHERNWSSRADGTEEAAPVRQGTRHRL